MHYHECVPEMFPGNDLCLANIVIHVIASQQPTETNSQIEILRCCSKNLNIGLLFKKFIYWVVVQKIEILGCCSKNLEIGLLFKKLKKLDCCSKIKYWVVVQ